MTWLLFLAMVGPCTLAQAPLEIGRWHLAAAVRLRSKDQKEAAYQELDKAIVWFPKSPELYLRRAEWKLADGQRQEAVADADRILELVPTRSASENYKWLMVHSSFLQNMGDFERAVDDLRKIEELSQRSGIPDRANALNGLAYGQALAKVDLAEALTHANKALELEPNSSHIIDTRGYVYYQQGQHEKALEDFDSALLAMKAEKVIEAVRAKATDSARSTKDPPDWRPKTLRDFESPGDRAAVLERLARATAVMHYHRALALAALDRKEDADKDLAVTRELTRREPDETLF